MNPLTVDPLQRFWAKVDSSGGPTACWPWQAGREYFGYGIFWLAGRSVKAHRFVYENAVRRLREGECVLHRCDVPACCNPSHLFVGTVQENVQDMVRKQRQARGERTNTARLRPEDVLEVRRRHAQGETQRSIADAFGVSNQLISVVVRREVWKHL